MTGESADGLVSAMWANNHGSPFDAGAAVREARTADVQADEASVDRSDRWLAQDVDVDHETRRLLQALGFCK